LLFEPQASSAAFIDGAATAWSKKPSAVWQTLSFLAMSLGTATFILLALLRRAARRIAAIILYRIRSSRAAVYGSKAQHSEQQ
jgi:hypothetical protein